MNKKEICKNCKYMYEVNQLVYDSQYKCKYGIGDLNIYGVIYTSLNFGCNKFENKKDNK